VLLLLFLLMTCTDSCCLCNALVPNLPAISRQHAAAGVVAWLLYVPARYDAERGVKLLLLLLQWLLP
jgi:hypothetical protein